MAADLVAQSDFLAIAEIASCAGKRSHLLDCGNRLM